MESLHSTENLVKGEAASATLQRCLTDVEYGTDNRSHELPDTTHCYFYPGPLINASMQLATSAQPAFAKQTQASSEDRSLPSEAQAPSQPQRPSKCWPAEPNNKAVGPWVMSNRQVQKRYRERRKAEKSSMEEQLENLTAQLESMRAKNNIEAGQNSTLEKAIIFRDCEISQLQERSHAMDTASTPVVDGSSSLHSQDETSVKLAAQPSTIQAYKGIVKGMVGVMLRLSQEGATPAVVQELEGAASSLIMLFMQTFIFSAHEGARLMKANLEHDHYQAGAAPSPQEDPKHQWQAVTDRLELRPDQRRQMANLRQHFLQSLSDCHEARQSICLGLQKGTQKVQTAYSTIETDAQAYVGSMLEVHHESRQLRENLRKQHRIWMDFYATIFRLWDARQSCYAAVHSFPKFPDLLAISSCVAMADASQQVPDNNGFRTHKLEMKRSPRYTHRLLAESCN